MKKYEFTGETLEFQGHTLKRIRYLRKIGMIEAGDLGGWIEHESNLSHEGNCFVLGEAKVFGNACIQEKSIIKNNAVLKDNAIVKGEVLILNNSVVGADTIVGGCSWIQGNSKIFFYNTTENNSSTDILLEHISGDTRIKSTTIEATGVIIDSYIVAQEIHGAIKILNEAIIDY